MNGRGRLTVLLILWLVSAIPNQGHAADPPRPGRPKPALTKPVPLRATRPVPSPTRARGGKDLGTLDEITIEGEIAVPQVLFITARDRMRFQDPYHRRYLASSADLARGTRFPLPRGVWARGGP